VQPPVVSTRDTRQLFGPSWSNLDLLPIRLVWGRGPGSRIWLGLFGYDGRSRLAQW